MRIETTLNHEHRLLSLVSDIFSSARWGASSHAELLETIGKRIYADSAWKRIPSWCRGRIEQRIRDEHSGMYSPRVSASDLDKLRFGKLHPADIPYVKWELKVDGQPVTSDEISKRRAAGDEGIWDRVKGSHVWNHRPEKTYN